MTDRKSLFAECGKCGEQWKIATLPVDLETMARLRTCFCPNCGEREQVFVCSTDGPYAVTEPREGEAQ